MEMKPIEKLMKPEMAASDSEVWIHSRLRWVASVGCLQL